MAISGTSNYEIEVPCLVAKGLCGCGFFQRFSTIWLETLTRIQILGYPDIIRYPIFRHLLDPHLVLEQLRTKPSLFGIRGYKGSHGLNMA